MLSVGSDLASALPGLPVAVAAALWTFLAVTALVSVCLGFQNVSAWHEATGVPLVALSRDARGREWVQESSVSVTAVFTASLPSAASYCHAWAHGPLW